MMGKLLPFMKFLEREAGFGFDIESYRIKFRGAELIEHVISTSCDIKSATEAEKICYVFDELKRVGLIDA